MYPIKISVIACLAIVATNAEAVDLGTNYEYSINNPAFIIAPAPIPVSAPAPMLIPTPNPISQETITSKPVPDVQRPGAHSHITVNDVNFAFNRADLTASGQRILAPFIHVLTVYPDIEVTISGYTDSIGGRPYNLKLSQLRANTVRDWLIAHGISSARIYSVLGFGKTHPVASNKTAAGRALNRRVDIDVLDTPVETGALPELPAPASVLPAQKINAESSKKAMTQIPVVNGATPIKIESGQPALPASPTPLN